MKGYNSFVILVCVLLISCLALTGCGSGKTTKIDLSQADDTGVYAGEILSLEEIEKSGGRPVSIFTSENDLYMLVILPSTKSTQESEEWETWLYRMDLQHPVSFEKMFRVVDDFSDICVIPGTDEFCLLSIDYSEDRTADKYYVKHLNAQGQLTKTIAMPEVFQNIYEISVGEMAIDKEGNYYFATDDVTGDYAESQIVVCDASGREVRRIKQNDFSAGFTYDKDGNLYYSDADAVWDTRQIRDVRDRRIESAIVQEDERIELVKETRGGILFRSVRGIWTLTEDGAKLLVDFNQEGMDYHDVHNVCMTPDGSIYMILWGSSIGYEPKLYQFTADGENADRENRTKICIAGKSIGDDVKSAASAFNMAQDKILVQTEEYGTDDAGEKKLLMDLATSDTIDILCVQNRYEIKNPERYLENIYPLMAEAGVTDNVLNACRGEETETCFYAFPGYWLHTMFLLGQKEGDTITLKQFRELFDGMDDMDGKNILYDMDRYALFSQMMRANMGDIYKADEKDVDMELINEIARTCLAVTGGEDTSLPVSAKSGDSISAEDASLPACLRNGDCLGAIVDLYEPCDYMMYLKMMEGKGGYVGLPVAETATKAAAGGNYGANTIMPAGGIYGVMRQSAHKEEALEFIRYLLGEEYQVKRYYQGRIPVSAKGLDRMMEIVTTDKDTVLEDGTELSPYSVQVGYGEYMVTIDALTEEEAAAFRKLLGSADRIYEMDGILSEIISEEMEQYFSGRRDLESTDEILKERIGIYLNE